MNERNGISPRKVLVVVDHYWDNACLNRPLWSTVPTCADIEFFLDTPLTGSKNSLLHTPTPFDIVDGQ